MRAAFTIKCGAGYCSTPGEKWRIRRLHKYSAEVFGKILCRKNACDSVSTYVRPYPAEYYFAAEQASGPGPVCRVPAVCPASVPFILAATCEPSATL